MNDVIFQGPESKEDLQAAVSKSAPQQPTPSTAASSWFSEVMELRKRASEYKKRAQGTHFAREHLAQLYARNADLWDTVSTRSSLSALSLESSTVKPSQK